LPYRKCVADFDKAASVKSWSCVYWNSKRYIVPSSRSACRYRSGAGTPPQTPINRKRRSVFCYQIHVLQKQSREKAQLPLRLRGDSFVHMLAKMCSATASVMGGGLVTRYSWHFQQNYSLTHGVHVLRLKHWTYPQKR